MSCLGDCSELGPPPDMILSMPPPPLSSFLVPRTVILPRQGNNSLPCIAAFMCEPSLNPNEQSGMEFIEMGRNGPVGLDDTWVFVLISSCVGVLILGALLAMLLMKCRESYNYSYHESNIKQPPLPSINEAHMGTIKSHGFVPGTIMYPTNHVQQQMTVENRALWAALTPHGTQHFISDSYCNPEDHYEVIDYGRKHEQYIPAENTISASKNSFENSGFVDYDYEDPTPLMESYNFDDMDSGYQEPQEIIGTLNRIKSRSIVSSPTRIENPNLAPLNMYPHRNGTLTLNKKSTLSRRVSDIQN